MRQTVRRPKAWLPALVLGAAAVLALPSRISPFHSSIRTAVKGTLEQCGGTASAGEQDAVADLWKQFNHMDPEARLKLAKEEYHKQRSRAASGSDPKDPKW